MMQQPMMMMGGSSGASNTTGFGGGGGAGGGGPLAGQVPRVGANGLLMAPEEPKADVHGKCLVFVLINGLFSWCDDVVWFIDDFVFVLLCFWCRGYGVYEVECRGRCAI